MEIIIYVEGGLVQDVFSDSPAKVIIYDQDNINDGDVPPIQDQKMKRLLEKGTANIGVKTFKRTNI